MKSTVRPGPSVSRPSSSLFHLHYSDRFARAMAAVGIALSVGVVAGVVERLPLPPAMGVWLALWVLYLSFVNAGQTFFGFVWETLLMEAGFLAVFLGSADVAPLLPAVLGLRWLLFRLEVGAGLITLRNDPAWRDLRALYYHHETQPIPNRLSRWFHDLPKPVHRLEGNEETLRLLGDNPFPERPPTFVRALLYRYRFTTPRERAETGAWWWRKLVGLYLPPVTLGLPAHHPAPAPLSSQPEIGGRGDPGPASGA